MDFIVGLPHTSRAYNSLWVIVDRLTKPAHFIPIATTYRVGQYAELYISHIVRYHGIPKSIISDRGSIFVARFLEQLHECLGTHLIRCSAYHPQIDRQMEQVAGCHAPWAVASGRQRAQHCAGDLNVFPIVLNNRK
jgi:hypothetical protein